MSKLFFISCAALMAVLAVMFYLDYNKDWKPYELAYYQKFGAKGAVEEVKQLNPKGTSDNERCITCHVPDIAIIGGKVAAQRIPLIKAPQDRAPLAHPDRITSEMVKTYGLPSQYAGQALDVTGAKAASGHHSTTSTAWASSTTTTTTTACSTELSPSIT